MEELTSMQISRAFKELLRGEKQEGQSFEDYIKEIRMKALSIDPSIDEKSSIEKDSYENPDIVKDNLGRDWKFPEGTFSNKH